MNTQDMLEELTKSTRNDARMYTRAIILLQDVEAEYDENNKIRITTIKKIEAFLDDSYEQALR